MTKRFSEIFDSKYRRIASRLHALGQVDVPYSYRPNPGGRPASVLLLCGLSGEDNDVDHDISVLLTRRTDRVATHKGQYALPGGIQDPGDGSIEATALRETEEEMGIPCDAIEVFGSLPPLWTPTGFQITPVVGMLRVPREIIRITPSPDEIDLWFWSRLEALRLPSVYSQEIGEVRHAEKTVSIPIDVFQIDAHRVWGATGAILKNFLNRWEQT